MSAVYDLCSSRHCNVCLLLENETEQLQPEPKQPEPEQVEPEPKQPKPEPNQLQPESEQPQPEPKQPQSEPEQQEPKQSDPEPKQPEQEEPKQPEQQEPKQPEQQEPKQPEQQEPKQPEPKQPEPNQPKQPESDPKHPESDPKQPESNPKQSDPKQPESDPKQPESDPKQPESDPKQPESESDPKQPESESDPKQPEPESDPKQPESDPKQPESNSKQLESDPKQPESDPKQPESDPKHPESDPKQPEPDSDPKQPRPESDPKQPESDPKQPESDPKQSQPESDPKQPEPESDPKQSESDPKQSESDPKQSESDPKQSESDPKQSESDPKQSESDPKQSESDPKQPQPESQAKQSQPKKPESKQPEQPQSEQPQPEQPTENTNTENNTTENTTTENTNTNKATTADASSATAAIAPSRLSKCTGCQLVLYCGIAHQKQDWPLHREFCAAAKRIMAVYEVSHPFLVCGTPTTGEEMERATLQVKYLLRTALDRPLQYYEEELSSFPQHCAVCYKFEKVKSCPQCCAVSYCSFAHARQDVPRHKRICGMLQLVYCAFKVHAVPSDIVTDLHKRVFNMSKTDLVGAFERATMMQLPAVPTASLSDYQLFASAADFSCIATICYALSFIEMRDFVQPTFVVFVVGATVENILWFHTIHTKFFFLQYSQVLKLDLYFIGPDVENSEDSVEIFLFQGQERTVHRKCFRLHFEDFCKKFNMKPSLIIAFNCGFSEYTNSLTHHSKASRLAQTRSHGLVRDTWAPALREMLYTYDLSIVFTSFTKLEAEFDYSALMSIARADVMTTHVERIFSVKQNPYRDLRPLRNWHWKDEEQIYYRNGYLQGVRTSLEY